MFDLINYLTHVREWSIQTFGPYINKERIIQHIKKELVETQQAKTPSDELEEWIDVVILGFDGAWRSGHSAEDVVAMLVYKQAVNERRQWPDWRTAPKDQVIEHIKGGDAT